MKLRHHVLPKASISLPGWDSSFDWNLLFWGMIAPLAEAYYLGVRAEVWGQWLGSGDGLWHKARGCGIKDLLVISELTVCLTVAQAVLLLLPLTRSLFGLNLAALPEDQEEERRGNSHLEFSRKSHLIKKMVKSVLLIFMPPLGVEEEVSSLFCSLDRGFSLFLHMVSSQ